MKKWFRNARLSPDNKERLNQINSIINEYRAQGLIMTLRQLYYQLVSRGVIPNKQAEYAKLSSLLKEGRMSGVVDWSAIEDRLREVEAPASWESIKSIMESAKRSFAMPRLAGQDCYVEVWVEKDALSGVLERVTQPYHVPIMVNRGYSSTTAIYDAFRRFDVALLTCERVRILYLGDFDPSGLQMIEDIKFRIIEFFFGDRVDPENGWTMEDFIADEGYSFPDFDIIPIALTRKQITQYNPPPNPAKKTDPRGKKFIKEHGTQSWEVDALRPEVLNQILSNAILDLIDIDKYNAVMKKEEAEIKKLQNIIKKL